MNVLFWFLLLIVQNAAFTWVSRARNSGDISYHAIASFVSNGVWFASQFLLIGMVAKPGMAFAEAFTLGCVYVCGTVTGSVLMHYASIHWLETGKRKVGA